ncbi:MAG: hypothetical protein WD382_01240 [Halofilum sp. (in: g-proteobacteria)]
MSNERRFADDSEFALGETAGEHRIDTSDEAADAALSLTRRARRSLRIFTRDLDARLYSNDAFRDAVSALARQRPGTEIRILVQDPTPAIRSNHRLISLTQHLSSRIAVRRVASDWAHEPCAFLIADGRGLLWRGNGERYEGMVDFRAGSRAAELTKWFDHVWDNSAPDPEFRTLAL